MTDPQALKDLMSPPTQADSGETAEEKIIWDLKGWATNPNLWSFERDRLLAAASLIERQAAEHAEDVHSNLKLQDEIERQANELDELREVQKVWGSGFNWKDAFNSSQAERCRLNVEVTNLKAEIERLRAESNYFQLAANHANEELEKLQADVERLREALKAIVEDDCGDNCSKIAHAALSIEENGK